MREVLKHYPQPAGTRPDAERRKIADFQGFHKFLEIQRMSSGLKLFLQLVQRELDPRLLVEEHAVETVAGDLTKCIFNDLLPKAWVKFLFGSVLVDYARRPDRHCKSFSSMFKIAGERSKKGIVDPQRIHMLAGIVFRDGVVEFNGVGIFILVRSKKGLKE